MLARLPPARAEAAWRGFLGGSRGRSSAADGPAAALRVTVVGDDPLAAAALMQRLTDQGLDARAQVFPEDAAEAARDAQASDVLLWDLGLDARAGAERLRAHAPEAPPIVVLLADDEAAAEAWAAGARGLVDRDAPGERLAAALVAAVRGLAVLDDGAAESLLGGHGSPAPAAELAEPLTPREREVLRLLAEGLSNKAIAGRLGISEHTAKFHVNSILGKLGAEGRTEAVVRATRLGLIAL